MRKSLAAVLSGALLLCLLVPSVALAEEQGDPSGTYVGTVKGSSGRIYEAWAQVGRPRLGWIIVTVKVADKPSFPIPARPTWTGPNSFTISPSVYVPAIVEGSGSATWTRTGAQWAVTGQGTGSVMGGPEGSGTGQGVRVSTEFIEPPLKAGPINRTVKKRTAGGKKPPVDKVGGALIAAGAMEQSAQASDGGKAEAALAADIAVLTGIFLCIFLGASMSGSQFADLWTASEGSES